MRYISLHLGGGGGRAEIVQKRYYALHIIWTADNQLSVCTESAWILKVNSLSIHLGCDLLRRAFGATQKFSRVFYAWYT